jgi:hypothetical protein
MTYKKNSPGALKCRLTNLADLDRRSAAYKAAERVRIDIINDLGGEDQLSTLERLAAQHAALASALVADSYGRWLKGEPIALTEIATVQNTFLRVASSLGFSRRAKDVTKSIESYLKDETKDE